VNRGVAILGDRVFVGTVDAHLVALDAKTGAVLWDVEVADYRMGYSITVAPLVVKDRVICGISGGEYGIRGFLDAYEAATGKRRWRYWTIPAPGEPGSQTWPGDSWKTGGGPTWVTGSFDPEQNLIIWGTGNPSPDWNGDSRKGDNLYSDSAIALDADTGKLKWYFQHVPHDVHDWDSVQVPVLVDDEFQGRRRKLIYWAHRNAFYYVLDRETGQFLLGKPFATQTWAKGLDEKGRPIRLPNIDPSPEGTYVWPGVQGATNWFSPSYSPLTKLLYVAVWENQGLYRKGEQEYSPGNRYIDSVPLIDLPDDPGHGAIRALNPKTGDRLWEYKLQTKPWAGVLSRPGNWCLEAATKAISLRWMPPVAGKSGGRTLAALSERIRSVIRARGSRSSRSRQATVCSPLSWVTDSSAELIASTPRDPGRAVAAVDKYPRNNTRSDSSDQQVPG
ncbi:MAG: hypothetical protein EXQ58_13670, partial [Acidobacteria bacterium]|nr:hypothetical protein [Acidobacteriota bacterium]